MQKLNKYNQRVNLSNSLIENSLPIDGLEEYFLYDLKVQGLYVRIAHRSKTFYICYHSDTRIQKRKKLARFGKVSVKQARELASDIVYNAMRGEDYFEQMQLKKEQEYKRKQKLKKVDKAFMEYYESHCLVHKKNHKSDLSLYSRNVKPVIGKKAIKDISLADLNKIHGDLKKTPVNANHVRSLMSHFLNWCEQMGYRDMHTNPTKFVKKYKENKRNRFLSDEELSRLGQAFEKLENDKRFDSAPLKIIKMLMYTGCRLSEIKDLKWSEVDLDNCRLNLEDSKTGKKSVPLGSKAMEILKDTPKLKYKPKGKKRYETMQYVFGNPKTGNKRHDIKRPWRALLEEAKISTETHVHDLRHTFASIGAMANLSPNAISTILGHANITTTQRYTHIQDRIAQSSADTIANTIAGYMKV